MSYFIFLFFTFIFLILYFSTTIFNDIKIVTSKVYIAYYSYTWTRINSINISLFVHAVKTRFLSYSIFVITIFFIRFTHAQYLKCLLYFIKLRFWQSKCRIGKLIREKNKWILLIARISYFNNLLFKIYCYKSDKTNFPKEKFILDAQQ